MPPTQACSAEHSPTFLSSVILAISKSSGAIAHGINIGIFPLRFRLGVYLFGRGKEEFQRGQFSYMLWYKCL